MLIIFTIIERLIRLVKRVISATMETGGDLVLRVSLTISQVLSKLDEFTKSVDRHMCSSIFVKIPEKVTQFHPNLIHLTSPSAGVCVDGESRGDVTKPVFSTASASTQRDDT